MDDNTHPYGAVIVDDYLDSERIAREEWPAYSLDLNTTENHLGALGRTECKYFSPPAILTALKTVLQEKRQLLDPAVVDHLIENITQAVNTVCR